jgi:hypothetical protein
MVYGGNKAKISNIYPINLLENIVGLWIMLVPNIIPILL